MHKNHQYHLIFRVALACSVSSITFFGGPLFANSGRKSDVVGSKGKPIIFQTQRRQSRKPEPAEDSRGVESQDSLFEKALKSLGQSRSLHYDDNGVLTEGWPADPLFLKDVKCYLEKARAASKAADGTHIQVDPCKLFLVNLGKHRPAGDKNCFTMDLCQSVPTIKGSYKCDGGKGDGTGGQVASGGQGGNVSGSKKSSGGAKVACGRHSGQIVPRGVTMHGLEQGFNSNDHKRATVIHDRMGSATSGCIQSVDYPEIEKFLIGHQTDRKCVAGGLTFVITEEEEKNPGQNCGRTKVGK